jgi:hypothetical protein
VAEGLFLNGVKGKLVKALDIADVIDSSLGKKYNNLIIHNNTIEKYFPEVIPNTIFEEVYRRTLRCKIL